MAATLHLKRGTAKPLHSGHPWVFKDAVASIDFDAEAGDEVRVVDDRGSVIGRGFYSPDSAIAVRLITRADVPINDETLTARIDEAIALRLDVLGLGGKGVPARTSISAGEAPAAPESHLLYAIDKELERIKAFAAQYGMDAHAETAELRKRRDELAKSTEPLTPSRKPAVPDLKPRVGPAM